MAECREKLAKDARFFLVANSRELLFDRVDDFFRGSGIEVKGGAYRRCFGFECNGFVDSDSDKLLKKSGKNGRVNSLWRWRISGGRRPTHTRR